MIEMGIFGKKREMVFAETHLDVMWFKTWLERVCDGTGRPQSQEVAAELLTKAEMVIMHENAPDVAHFCPGWAGAQLEQYSQSADGSPWGMISLILGFPESLPDWKHSKEEFIESRLNRFADIMINPEIVG